MPVWFALVNIVQAALIIVCLDILSFKLSVCQAASQLSVSRPGCQKAVSQLSISMPGLLSLIAVTLRDSSYTAVMIDFNC